MRILIILLALAGVVNAAEIPVKNGDSIVFLGDSITRDGDKGDGYIKMFAAGMKENGIELKTTGAGIGGNKSNHMKGRLDKHVISRKPQFMVLSCGVNDVYHGFKKPPAGTSLEDYQKNITEIIDRAQAANIKVIVMTATMLTESVTDKRNAALADYNKFLREIAAAKNCILIDQYQAMLDTVTAYKKLYPNENKRFVTVDGIHMNPLGNKMMATALLKGMNLNNEQLVKAEKAIDNLKTNQSISMSIGAYEYLTNQSTSKKVPFEDYAGELFKEALPK